jgi:hypothetical protein
MQVMLIFTLPPMQGHAPENIKNHTHEDEKNRYRDKRYSYRRLDNIVEAPGSNDQMNDPDNDSADEQEGTPQPDPL